MKYLVVSDNHGDRNILVELASMYRNKVDRMFHCGDSELEPTDSLWQDFIVVKGNCDYSSAFPTQLVEKVGKDTIFLTHGHLFNVRLGLTHLALAAEVAHATLVLVGHTHEIGCEMHNHCLFLNPGSISQPRGSILIKSYVIIESTEKKFIVHYFNRTHQRIDQLQFVFEK